MTNRMLGVIFLLFAGCSRPEPRSIAKLSALRTRAQALGCVLENDHETGYVCHVQLGCACRLTVTASVDEPDDVSQLELTMTPCVRGEKRRQLLALVSGLLEDDADRASFAAVLSRPALVADGEGSSVAVTHTYSHALFVSAYSMITTYPDDPGDAAEDLHVNVFRRTEGMPIDRIEKSLPEVWKGPARRCED